MSPDLINEFGKALLETSWMMSVAVIFAIIIGSPAWYCSVCNE